MKISQDQVIRAIEDRIIDNAIMTDPKIQAWMAQFGRNKDNTTLNQMRRWLNDPRQNYDYRRAILHGLRPGLDPESGTLHWPDVDTAGQPLKGHAHGSYRYTLNDLAPMPSAGENIQALIQRLMGNQ